MAIKNRLSWIGRLLPPRRQRAVPWSGMEILVSLFLVFYFVPSFCFAVLQGSHFFTWLYGADFPAGNTNADILSQTRVGLWLTLTALPAQVLGLLLLLNLSSGTLPYQLGLTTPHLRRNIALGALLALVVTPALLGLNFLIASAFERWTPIPINKHPLLNLGEQSQSWWEVLLLLATAVVAAPLLEELVFRGLLLRWFAQRWDRGRLAVFLALLVALSKRSEELAKAVSAHDLTALAIESIPAVFVLLMVPIFLLVRRRARTPAGPALFGVALLFAAMHSSVWPTPIALFALGLVLGWLSIRTASLVGPIILHGLFNLASCLLLFLAR
jgi:membrane protease YdiL (CAAX protease family)